MHRHVVRSVLACASILPFLSLSWGQSDTGTITGTAKDTSAAVVAHVKITVTDSQTNADVFIRVQVSSLTNFCTLKTLGAAQS
jgi:hypothetical protein